MVRLSARFEIKERRDNEVTFACYREDREGPVINRPGKFVQITYDSVRDETGETIAYMRGDGDWRIGDRLPEADDRAYSDIIIEGD